MRAVRTVAILVRMCALTALGAADASATISKLIVKASGEVAPEGTPATGVLRFGACGTLNSSGTLIVNDRHNDTAELPTAEEAPTAVRKP